jgi:hypothetical protein
MDEIEELVRERLKLNRDGTSLTQKQIDALEQGIFWC